MRGEGAPKFLTYDQLAMAIVLRPDIVLASRMVSAAVELRGELTRGQMVLGARGKRPGGQGPVGGGQGPGEQRPGGQGAPPTNVCIIDTIDQTIYEELFLHAVEFDFTKK